MPLALPYFRNAVQLPMRPWHFPVAIWVFLLVVSDAHAQASDPIAALAESFKGNVAAIRANFEEESEQFGFGFVTGEANGKLYLATAAHVVADRTLKTDSIRLRFAGDPRWFKARLIRAWETEDLALLEMDKPLSYKWKKEGIDLSPAVYQRVRFIGQNSDPPNWGSPGSGDIHDISSGHIRFAIGTIRPGCSGAPLLTEKGIAGLIFQDDAGSSSAIKISRVRELFLAGGQMHFFALEAANTATTAAPSMIEPVTTASAKQFFPKNDLVFELEDCRGNGRFVECSLTIRNNGRRDHELRIYGKQNSRIIAAGSGFEYFAGGVTIADFRHASEVRKTIVAGSSVKAFVTFDLVTDTVKSISKIEISCYSSGSGYYDIDFRNVSVK